MGRTMLIVVLLMGTIYAGIVTRLQSRILYLPEIITRNLITKQAESVSDYALRLAIRDGNYLRSTQMSAADTSSTVFVYSGENEYAIQDSKIDSIRFVFKSAAGSGNTLVKQYLATSYVTGDLMGHEVGYQAKVAYELSMTKNFDNLYYNYYSMNQNNWKDLIEDESGNENSATRVGKNLKSNPHGVDGGRYAEFGGRGSNEATYIFFDKKPVSVEKTCTLAAWARIATGYNKMTLLWLPPDRSDPEYTGEYNGVNFYKRPTAAIMYEKPNIVFIANTVDGQEMRINYPVPATQAINQLAKDNWSHYSLTYDHGILNAYVGGVLVGTKIATNYPVDMVRNYGFYLGREHLAAGQANNFKGHLDEVGFSPYVLTSDNLLDYYTSIATPTKILYFRD